MGSYVESDYLAKLLLPKSQILNSETVEEIKIKSHLGAPKEKTADEVITKITENIEKIPYAGLQESWAEMDFIKDYITPTTTSEKVEEETKGEKGVQREEKEKPELNLGEEETKEFIYLDPENMDLDYEFGLCNDPLKNSAIYNVHICGFYIETGGDQPFLKFLFELFGETFGFPHFDFTCPSNVGNPASFVTWIWDGLNGKKSEEVQEHDSQENSSHIYFINECLKRIMGIVNLNDHSNPDVLKTMYKGFHQDKTDPLQIYAFFDFSDMDLEQTEFRRIWAITDEIVNHKQIMGFGVDPKVIPLFGETSGLALLLDKEGHKVQTPYVMYLCELKDGKYVNVYNEDDADTIYEERAMHPIFGRFYIFSVNPLDFQGEKSIFKIERYAVFTNDPIYFLKDTTDPLFLNPDFDDMMKGENNESIYFKSADKIPLWCIKSSDDFSRL
jgi:hypothetical protein